MLPRFTHGWGGTWNEAPGGKGMAADSLPRSPAEYARRFYYDTLLFDSRAIRYLLDIIGESQLLVGTDYPYMEREQPVGKTLAGMGIPQETLDAITWDNCFRFLGVTPPAL
jgi:aminocarboxymuconate-semialdehyde decarboxylase